MTTVFYRKEKAWRYPQLDFGDGGDYVVVPERIENDTPDWIKVGLTQTVLANGYDDSICNVILSRKRR